MESEEASKQSQDEFPHLLARVRQGDELATAELVQRYERAVLRSVRARLGKSMRSALDSMDIVQSVHRSLLVGLRNEKYQFNSVEQLVALAVVMVQRKVAHHWRKMGKMPTSRLDLHLNEDGTSVDPIASRDPSVSRVLSANDLLDQFLSQLDQFDQQLVRLKLRGFSSVETAKLLGHESAFIRMRWTRLRKTLRDNGFSDA